MNEMNETVISELLEPDHWTGWQIDAAAAMRLAYGLGFEGIELNDYAQVTSRHNGVEWIEEPEACQGGGRVQFRWRQ